MRTFRGLPVQTTLRKYEVNVRLDGVLVGEIEHVVADDQWAWYHRAGEATWCDAHQPNDVGDAESGWAPSREAAIDALLAAHMDAR